MTDTRPSITVLMPAHNAAKYLCEAIGSVLTQTFADFELIVVDDGSTDDTPRLLRTISDPRLRVVTQEKKGIAAALNLGLSLATADYVARFDADDICHPDRLRIQYAFAIAHPEYGIIGSAADYIDAEGGYMFTMPLAGKEDSALKGLPYGVCPFIHSTVLYKKDLVLKAGGYNDHAYTFEDHLLWRNIVPFEKVYNLPVPLIQVRLNPESFTMDERWRPRLFREIKDRSLRNGKLAAEDSEMLGQMSREPVNRKWKQAAYHALCGKKFLFNNYQPRMARRNTWKAIRFSPTRLDNYAYLLMSFSPKPFIHWLYNQSITGGKEK